MSWSLVLFRLEAVCPHLFVIDERDIDNIFSTDRATRASHTERPVLTDDGSARQQSQEGPKAKPHSAQCKLNTARADKAQQSSVTSEYTVGRIVAHASTGDNIRNVVRWYGYTASNDTVEPPKLTPHHFIARYW